MAIGALLVLAGCDFQAAQDAFDDFDLVIGLEPINTVVNGIVTDNTNDELVAATLTFTGEDASGIIDAYSDPVSELDAESGVVTFGIRNSLVPTGADPVEFTVTVSAPGYFTTSRTVQITEPGDAEIRLSLTRTDPTAVVQGTASVQSTAVQASTTGAASQTTTIQTQTPPQTESLATASLTVPAGTRALTAEGTPLTGQITTSLRAYDTVRGLQSLPISARTLSDGTQPLLLGAVHFKMVDEAGNVAVTFDRPTGKTLGKQASTCANGGGTTLRIGAFSPPGGFGGGFGGGIGTPPSIDVLGSAGGFGGPPVVVGFNIPLSVDNQGAFADLCIGGSNENVATRTIATPGMGGGGFFFSGIIAQDSHEAGPMHHRLNIQNQSPAATAVELSLTYPGGSSRNSVTVPPGSTDRSLADWFADGGRKTFNPQHTFRLQARMANGEEVSINIQPDPMSGASTLTLPVVVTEQTYDIVASLECANPASRKFDVGVTNESLDAVTVIYQVAGSSGTWNVIKKASITSKEATDAAIRIRGRLRLLPNTAYEFIGALGGRTANATATTPGSGPVFSIALSPEDVGLTCKSR